MSEPNIDDALARSVSEHFADENAYCIFCEHPIREGDAWTKTPRGEYSHLSCAKDHGLFYEGADDEKI